ncbi:MAG: endonuclease MutS2 [Bacteroidia bacterium]|nr:endonuclease MutS2 [Bacteroidia bacterium]
MHIYTNQALQKLGYPILIEAVRNYCISQEGKNLAEKLHPRRNIDEIERLLKETEEYKNLLLYDTPLPLNYLPPIESLLNKASIEGTILLEEEFFRLGQWLKTVREAQKYLVAKKLQYPHLYALLGEEEYDTSFTREIEQVIGPDGKILPNASEELVRIRKALQEQNAALRQMLESILRTARNSGWTDSKEITFRNDRLVIPINTDFKGKIKGIIQDVSASGQTVYIEPLEALQLNNEIRELHIREQNEIFRLLSELTSKLRPFVPAFQKYLKLTSTLDLIRAKAKLAIELKAEMPQIDRTAQLVDLRVAYHPLLLLQKKVVVPLNLKLDTQKRIVVISGPNSGGKSVTLQTVGLLALMTQTGLLPTCSEKSTLPIFNKLFVEIGDDQSIQNDLSTYTSHLKMMRLILDRLDRFSLFLIDEFGSGTDPQLGGPIAEALLEEFVKKRGFGVITTHYSNLKEFAAICPSTENAAMYFNLKTMEPTYQLEQGVPGSSYAFEIALRVGIPKVIIERAKGKVGKVRLEFEKLLAELRSQQLQIREREKETEKLKKELEVKNKELEKVIEKYKQTEKEILAQKKKILKEAKISAAQLLKETNAKIENIIRQIKESQAEKEVTRTLRQILQEELAARTQEIEEEEKIEEILDSDQSDKEKRTIQVNDWVRLPDSVLVGKVLEVKGNKALVATGEVKATFRVKDLRKVENFEEKPQKVKSNYFNLGTIAKVASELDVRGMRVEEALKSIEKYMDNVIMSGIPQVAIIHGKGSGILRLAIREFLQKNFAQIKKIYDAPENEGGSGKTICVLRG